MTIAEVFYSQLLGWIQNIVSSPDLEDYYNAEQDLANQEIIFDFSEYLRTQAEEMEKSLTNNELYPNYISLEKSILDFSSTFDNYNFHNLTKILLIIKTSKLIGDQIGDFSLTNTYNTIDFMLIDLGVDSCSRIAFYHYVNGLDFSNSFLLISTNKLNDFENYIIENNVDFNLLYSLMNQLALHTLNIEPSKYVLIKMDNNVRKNRIESMIQLHYISDGLPLHVAKEYTSKPKNIWRDEIVVENKYQQFTDTFYVISEYNESKDVLSKYLKIYHVIEDFMYKHLLVDLEEKNNGELFSIRDFKRMYEKVNNNEPDSLKKFINKVYDLEYQTNTYFKDRLFLYWTNFISSPISQHDLTELLTRFNVNQQSINLGNYASILSTLIYSVRNSIVHNKTTEFHLTYNTLDDKTFKILELVLIPTLEEIIFLLLSHHEKFIVWFKFDRMMLWQD